MKRMLIVSTMMAAALVQTTHAWPSNLPQIAGYAQPYSCYAPGACGPWGGYAGNGGYGYGGPYTYGAYPFQQLHYSGLYPTYGAGNTYRTWPYYPSYSGAYPYSYQYGYRYNPYTVYSTVANVSVDVLTIYQMPERAEDLEDVDKTWAWGYMAEGNYDRASAIFAAMERQTPGAGWPKLGTGLMAGFTGDYRKAVYQFRRAFRFDPSSPGLLPTEKDMQEKVRRMSAYFKREANNGRKPDADAEFMVAALAYLTGDNIAAQNAIEKAIMHGDKSRDARNLRQLVDESLNEHNDELLAAQQSE